MFYFKNDYSEGCHPAILQALTQGNLQPQVGYGTDAVCREAAELLRQKIQCPGAAVHFLAGGTQTNQTALAAFLRPHQCALAADSGHINVHETGAIEATGHKVVTCPHQEGRLTPAMIHAMAAAHPDEHMVKPALVYISQSTEWGTVYTRAELEEISACCRSLGLYLYLDGARLAYALASPACDLSLADLARLCDAFYLGGTKCGALFGEALVIVRPELQTDFRYLIKQRGGLLAKGWLLGLQFLCLLEEDRYLELGRHAVTLGQTLQEGMLRLGMSMHVHSPTNQIFPRVPTRLLPRLAELCVFELMGAPGEEFSVIRLVTSWATREETVTGFLNGLADILPG